MRTVKVFKGDSRRRREIEVPETWEEAHQMLLDTMDPHNDRRGGNVERMSVCARVAFGMFADTASPADPTIVLVYLMQRICKANGAGL